MPVISVGVSEMPCSLAILIEMGLNSVRNLEQQRISRPQAPHATQQLGYIARANLAHLDMGDRVQALYGALQSAQVHLTFCLCAIQDGQA